MTVQHRRSTQSWRADPEEPDASAWRSMSFEGSFGPRSRVRMVVNRPPVGRRPPGSGATTPPPSAWERPMRGRVVEAPRRSTWTTFPGPSDHRTTASAFEDRLISLRRRRLVRARFTDRGRRRSFDELRRSIWTSTPGPIGHPGERGDPSPPLPTPREGLRPRGGRRRGGRGSGRRAPRGGATCCGGCPRRAGR